MNSQLRKSLASLDFRESPPARARDPRSRTLDDGLTEKQREVLEFIRSVYRDRGVPPPVREIMARFGFTSPNGAMCHVKALRKKGFLMPGVKSGRGGHSLRSLVPTASPGHCRCCGRAFPPPGGGGVP